MWRPSGDHEACPPFVSWVAPVPSAFATKMYSVDPAGVGADGGVGVIGAGGPGPGSVPRESAQPATIAASATIVTRKSSRMDAYDTFLSASTAVEFGHPNF